MKIKRLKNLKKGKERIRQEMKGMG